MDPIGLFGEGLEPHKGLDYFIEPPTIRMVL